MEQNKGNFKTNPRTSVRCRQKGRVADPAVEAIELWMLGFGMKKEDNWTPLGYQKHPAGYKTGSSQDGA